MQIEFLTRFSPEFVTLSVLLGVNKLVTRFAPLFLTFCFSFKLAAYFFMKKKKFNLGHLKKRMKLRGTSCLFRPFAFKKGALHSKIISFRLSSFLILKNTK